MKKSIAIFTAFISLAVFGVLGLAKAEGTTGVDGPTLDAFYDAVFHRAPDAEGRGFFIGKDFREVLNDFRRAPEQRYYGALFKAVKSYEEAQRAPGTLTQQEKDSYLELVNSALSNLLAWVGTLPDQDPCRGVVSPTEARAAIIAAHDSLSVSAQAASEESSFTGGGRVGPPGDIVIFPKCLLPTPRPSLTPIVCTADAKLCPNGTYVGRTGPHCEFVCPPVY